MNNRYDIVKTLEEETKKEAKRLEEKELIRKEEAMIRTKEYQVYKKQLREQGEVQKYMAAISRNSRERRRNLHPQETFYTTLMEASPRFIDLVSATSAQTNKYTSILTNYAAQTGRSLFRGTPLLWPIPSNCTRMENWLEKKFKDKKELDIPDLKYFTALSDQGVLEVNWVTDHIPHLFKKEDGTIDQDKMNTFQGELLEAFDEWFSNELRDEHGVGYFMGPDHRVYSLNDADPIPQAQGGGFRLRNDVVLARYDRQDCDVDPQTGALTPKLNANPLPGQQPLHMSAEQFEQLRDNQAHPERSFDAFLDARYQGKLDVEHTPYRGP